MAEEESNKKRKTQWLSNLVPFGFDLDTDPLRNTAMAFRYPSRLFEYMNEGFSMPKVDIADNGDSFTVRADMPDLDKRNIKLTITESSISIRASKAQEKEAGGKNFYSRERSSVGYYRTVSLPEEIRKDSAKARYENGTLRIDVKKLRPSKKGREVRVD
jgi:HSP20 family protein